MFDHWINGIRWNLSDKKTRRFASADAIVVTLPKSGTTWLRVFLYSYFSGLDRREFTMNAEDFTPGKIPRIVITQDLFFHVTEPKLLARLRGRHLIPPRQRREKPILLLVRDPRDVMVSLYFELSKKSVRRKFVGELGEMIEHPKFGIRMIVEIMNSWIREWADKPNFKLIHYETCRTESERTFREVLHFLGFKEIDEPVLQQSLQFASFENMQKLEAQHKIPIGELLRTDVKDPESFRVRRGKIGGYRDYFDSDRLLVLERAIAHLDRRYGYN
ncbi:MAG TPA: sulfotransferase domain-containing protein [Candidatus Acidoferrales bacterium]|nr:sulfotransferase domain-containing protein [Candidatus Acidoferrales bacterium]